MSFSTAEATQTFIHMNRLAASTFWAIGTHWALEKRPMMRSTFSWLSRRSDSLMETSTLLCASA